MEKVYLFLIDPQVDFCDTRGNLSVKGANEDMLRLSAFIARNRESIDRIFVTQDTHRLFDIAHPIFWSNKEGQNPKPFTVISREDVESGKWMAYYPKHRERALNYVKRLEEKGKYQLRIWPPHCLLGSPGQAIYGALFEELLRWEKETGESMTIFFKGINAWTEHYSVFQPEAPEPNSPDPTVQFNSILLNQLVEGDRILVAGEASSHCVAASVRDLVENTTPTFHKKIVLLKDAMSPVEGCESLEESFFQEMSLKNITISDTMLFKFQD